MKQLFYSILLGVGLLAYCPSLWGQLCDPKGISTDPSNIINDEKDWARNVYFDWTQEEFSINSIYVEGRNISSPFFQGDNTIISRFLDNPDRLPEDGWELVKFNLGLDLESGDEIDPVGFVYFMLYNKYTSVLRVFVAGRGNEDYDGAVLTLEFDDGSLNDYYPSVLSLAASPVSVQGDMITKQVTTASGYLNDATKWFFGDFPIAYDPCVCKYKSSLVVKVALIRESTISLTGLITGNITSITNGQGQVNESGFSWAGFAGAGQKAAKSYNEIDKFITKQVGAFGNANSQIQSRQSSYN